MSQGDRHCAAGCVSTGPPSIRPLPQRPAWRKAALDERRATPPETQGDVPRCEAPDQQHCTRALKFDGYARLLQCTVYNRCCVHPNSVATCLGLAGERLCTVNHYTHSAQSGRCIRSFLRVTQALRHAHRSLSYISLVVLVAATEE